jgi:hypothetical protein
MSIVDNVVASDAHILTLFLSLHSFSSVLPSDHHVFDVCMLYVTTTDTPGMWVSYDLRCVPNRYAPP